MKDRTPIPTGPASPDEGSSARVWFAGADDTAAIVSAYNWLFAAPGAPPPHWEPETARARLSAARAASDCTVLVAVRSDELVGFCTVYLDIVSVRYGQRAWLEDLAVAPHERSRGIGTDLLDAAMSWARTHGATHLELDSAVARHDAHRFYERHAPTARSACFSWDLTEPRHGGTVAGAR